MRVARHRRVRYAHAWRAGPLPPPVLARARHRRAPRARERDRRRSSARSARATGSGGSAASPPAVQRASSSRPCIPPAYVDAHRALCAARRRGDRPRHGRVVGAPTRRRCTRRAARSRWSTRCSRGEARVRRRALHRPPGPPRRAGAGDGLLPVQQRRGRRRGTRSTRTALERVLILDWDVHHGNGTNDIFHATDEVLFVSIHQSPLYPGTGPASRRRRRARATATRSTCRCRAGSGDARLRLAGRARRRAARRARTRRGSCWCRRASTRTRDDPLAGCEVHRRRASRRWRRRCGALADELGVPARRSCSRAATTSRRWRARSARTLEVLGRGGRPPAGARTLAVAPAGAAARASGSPARWPALALAAP